MSLLTELIEYLLYQHYRVWRSVWLDHLIVFPTMYKWWFR